MDPKHVIAQGYDHIVQRYSDWGRNVRAEERARYTTLLLESLHEHADVLELGCGAGIPTTQQLAQRFSVTGVDISEQSILLAQKNVPTARFIKSDMSELSFPAESFDAVAAFYSIIHVPRAEHRSLLESILTWLRPNGLLVVTMGAVSEEAKFKQDWLGAPMYWSHFDAPTNRALVQAVGFRIVSANEETADENGKPITFLWIVGQKPS